MLSIDQLLIILGSITIRSLISHHPHSGQGKPPLFGDYEAQRHWQEVTNNLPVEEWYFNSTRNDLQYWGLDYPPLTAYHSYLVGLSAPHKSFVEFYASRGLETTEHKTFMRNSVLFADISLFLPAAAFFSKSLHPDESRRKFNQIVTLSAISLYPGLALIDNGHFQYNNISLGLFLFAAGCLLRGWDLTGSMMFVAALNYKQMELYHALPFFFYLLGKSLRQPTWFRKAVKLGGIASVVLITFIAIWWPFLSDTEQTLQVLRRIFPIARGVFEDKVANFWCTLNIFVKIKTLIAAESAAVLCLAVTCIAVLPSNIYLLLNPSEENFMLSQIITSLGFFLFSFQVHEKSILLAAIPVAAFSTTAFVRSKAKETSYVAVWFLSLSTLSMWPLLQKDGLGLPTLSLTTFFIVLSSYCGLMDTSELGQVYLDSTAYSRPGDGKKTPKKNRIVPVKEASFLSHVILSSIQMVSIIGAVALALLNVYAEPPTRYPDLWPVLISVYCSVHFIGAWMYFQFIQFFSSEVSTTKKDN